MNHAHTSPLCASVLAIAGCLIAPPAEAESTSGFIGDSNATLTLRNFYMNRNMLGDATTQDKAEEWTQNFILDYKSGFTDGTVGFGVDALGLYSIKLDGGRGTAGTQLLPIHDDGRPADQFGRLAAAGKMRISQTELKVGEWAPLLPVLRSDDGRSLTQTFQGAQITSKEIDGLMLTGGQFRSNSPRNDGGLEDMFMNTQSRAQSDRFNFVGSEYSFNQNQTMIGAWHAELQDVYQQQYLQVLHRQPAGDWTLGANLGYFFGKEDGKALAGDLNNRTASALLSASTGAHTFYIGLQKVSGEDAWMRINGTSGGQLANDSFSSSFDNARERSWQVRHDYNFAALGLPGLTMMNRYIRASDAHVSGITVGSERARESELGYVVQSGQLKGLSTKWRNISMRRNWGNNTSFDENRLIISYPLSLL
ncbi:OprD family porin [Pseudomonas sp. TTU2014-080ASC]|uniref:OprD family porin n=1 Tax=Pseudomonas sp. TTU2014-080ASC TaxID=1729724 RepID=UPI00071862F8|nr:OprD family porin [Pseudomonas sp. TTU2014-080ASC]KRW58834.1 porin [Pseudomonas sp. TTU2014-080ASC]